jgi:hypothetical protein
MQGYRAADGTRLQGLSTLTKEELLAKCKDLGLHGRVGLMDLDHNIIRWAMVSFMAAPGAVRCS